MTTQKPEALRLANILRGIDTRSRFSNERLSSASDALENQHARITDLESQLAQRFDAADVATAAAQGFRDGVASVSAGSEPEDAADPLQGAANWLAEAHGQFSPVVLSGCLMIGYNRAKRLHDAALAARKQGEKQ